MKKTSIISLLIGCMALGSVTTSCEDMLSPDSERHSYVVAQDTLYSYWGIIKSWQNIAERYIILGECRGELVSGTSFVSDSINAMLNFDMGNCQDGSNRFLKASDFYHVINSCNAYLADCDRVRTTGTLEPYMLKEAAQVEAIRAWTYLQLVQIYDEVPFRTEPLLTTDDISNFMKAPKTVNSMNLINELEAPLKEALQVELRYGQPQYESYGFNQLMCHSSKVMIPLNVVLGDLYLTANRYEEAAKYYYDYLSNNQGQGHVVAGGVPTSSFCYAYQTTNMDQPRYGCTWISTLNPWSDKNKTERTSESITTIPSSTNILWGSVLRGVQQIYGFDSKITVATGEYDVTLGGSGGTKDTTVVATSANVTLTPQQESKQLTASQAYLQLTEDQDFELYEGTSDTKTQKLVVAKDIPDGRRYWLRDSYVSYSNGLTGREKFICKMGSSFSTVAHVIYRKSMIWLRFAEALNRAGYPSYAFAILRSGLCSNKVDWYPSPGTTDYAVKDSSHYFVTSTKDTIPATYKAGTYGNNQKAALVAALDQMITDGDLDATEVYDENNDLIATKFKVYPLSYENYPDDVCTKELYYLDQREAKKTPYYLNFNLPEFNGTVSGSTYLRRENVDDMLSSFPESESWGTENGTVGIHSHGCGRLKYGEKDSKFDYVKKVIEKAAQPKYGRTLTKDDIYSIDHTSDDIVIKCVEDLIVDEEALELAFEGTRFFDLMRVDNHRGGDGTYIADKLASRKPGLTRSQMFFPLPQR